jgi:choice-of-anchor B domain-containing protein
MRTYALAHHDDEKGNVTPTLLEIQALEFENVVAATADEDSNAPNSFAPCIDGMAADTYPCDGVDMLSHLLLGDLGLTFANDIWGWTDPQTRRDYALIGGAEGMVAVEVTDPKRPVVKGILPSASLIGGQFWRDIKVYADHAYIVSEYDDHGMQVFDLTELRGLSGPPVTLTQTAYYDLFGHAHNVAINEDTGYAYAVGTDTCAGGLHMIDISTPASPEFAGCFEDHGYMHDTQCVIYEGPDLDYQDREICFSSAANFDGTPFLNTVSIADVTDKSSPTGLSNMDYAGDGYSHQGWLTPDHAYFLHNDELDELFFGVQTTTRIWDMSDLLNPYLVNDVEHATTAIGHNAYTKGRWLFASNYTAGLQIFDTTLVGDGELPEVAYFDLYPENDNASFEGGTWSNYPYFSQPKLVAVSSMDRGLFLLRPRIGN